jgi:hypothetical protein
MNQLNPKALGLALGILWGVGVLFMGLLAMVCSWAQPMVDWLSLMYLGYSASIPGALIGTLWAFVDAFLGGWVLAWLYNRLAG